jgi:ATP-dependent DNA ligase
MEIARLATVSVASPSLVRPRRDRFSDKPAPWALSIVAKRRDRPYRSRRSPDWIKVNNPDAPAATRLIEE